MHSTQVVPDFDTVRKAILPTVTLRLGTPVNYAEGPPLPSHGLGAKPSPFDEARGELFELDCCVFSLEIGVRFSIDSVKGQRVGDVGTPFIPINTLKVFHGYVEATVMAEVEPLRVA